MYKNLYGLTADKYVYLQLVPTSAYTCIVSCHNHKINYKRNALHFKY